MIKTIKIKNLKREKNQDLGKQKNGPLQASMQFSSLGDGNQPKVLERHLRFHSRFFPSSTPAEPAQSLEHTLFSPTSLLFFTCASLPISSQQQLFNLLIPAHPLKLSLDEPSFRKIALSTPHLTLSQTNLYHIHFSASSLDRKLLDDRTMPNTWHIVDINKLLNE